MGGILATNLVVLLFCSGTRNVIPSGKAPKRLIEVGTEKPMRFKCTSISDNPTGKRRQIC